MEKTEEEKPVIQCVMCHEYVLEEDEIARCVDIPANLKEIFAAAPPAPHAEERARVQLVTCGDCDDRLRKVMEGE